MVPEEVDERAYACGRAWKPDEMNAGAWIGRLLERFEQRDQAAGGNVIGDQPTRQVRDPGT